MRNGRRVKRERSSAALPITRVELDGKRRVLDESTESCAKLQAGLLHALCKTYVAAIVTQTGMEFHETAQQKVIHTRRERDDAVNSAMKAAITTLVTITKMDADSSRLLEDIVSKKANSTEDLIEITKAAQPRASTIQRPGTARMVAGLRNSVAGPSDGFYASGGFEEFSTDPVAEFSRPFNAGGQGGPSQVMTLSPVQQSPPPKEEAKGKNKKGGGFSLFSKDNVRR